MDLKELGNGVDPSSNWYYQSKKIPLFKYFSALVKEQQKKITVIDFGSGSGFFAYELFNAFPEHIEDVLLIDIGYSEEEMEASKNTQVKKLRYIPEGINDSVVIMMDVLEHIEDDYAILEDIKKRVGLNAHFFITVPAFMSIWSSHDVYLGHYRRYTISMVTKLLAGTKCKINSQYYIFGMVFPLVWILRRLRKKNMTNPSSSDMKPVPGPVNFILKTFLSFEMNFRKMNKLFGLTTVAEGKLN